MPLNRNGGENLDGLHGGYVVIPTRAVANLSNVKIPQEEWRGVRKTVKMVPIFDDAVSCALIAFMKAGSIARPFDDEDVLVQAYPEDGKVAIMFQRMIAGQEHFVTRVYELPPPVMDIVLNATSVRLH